MSCAINNVEMLERRRLFSTAVSLVGTSGPDNFVISIDSTGLYSFSGAATTPASVASSDLSSVSITGGGGTDTLTIEGGNPTIQNDLGSDGSSFTVEATSGTTVAFDATEHLAALTIDSGAIATLLATGNHVLETGSLTIAGSANNWTGQFDLTNNNLIMHNGNVATISNQVAGGYAGGNWTGEGITSSAAANDTSFLTALGSIQNSVNGLPTGATLYTSFASQTAVNTDVLVRYTFYGDANLDGRVDGSDYSRIDNGYLSHATGWFNGDFNYDRTIDGSDYTLIDNAFNTQGPSAVSSPVGPVEPTGVQITQAVTGETDLQWNPSPDPNVVSYNIYTGTDPGFVPSSNDLIASGVPENGYSYYFDADPSITWYYKVIAVNSSGVTSIPSASSNGAADPASTSASYTDAPDLSAPPDSTYYVDNDGNSVDPSAFGPAAVPAVTPAAPTKVLVSFYGAGHFPPFLVGFGNIHLAAISKALGGTLNSTTAVDQTTGATYGVPYLDFQFNSALSDLLANLDSNGDKIITAAEISAKNVSVIGYSLGANAAANLTRMLVAPNPHLMGFQTNTGTAKYPHITTAGGYNLSSAVPITNLVTLDPVNHGVFELSRLLRTTDGPLGNVVSFTSYYELRGGTATTTEFDDPNGQLNLGPDANYTIGNGFSALIHGDFLNSKAQNGTAGEVNVNTTFANSNVIIAYRRDAQGSVIYGRFKGSQVQHDIVPFFAQQKVITLINNS